MLERPFWYAAAESLTANQTIYDRRIEIRPTADFYARAMALYTASGAVAGRLRRADGAYFTGPDFFHLDGFVHSSGNARWTPFLRQMRYPANGAFVYDLQDLGGAGDATIYPVLLGVERYSELARAPHPAKYIEEDYSIRIQATITGAGTQLFSIPLFCDTGDAFAIRTMSWAAVGTAPTTMHFRLWDYNDQLFSNTWVPLRALFDGPLTTNSPYPATPFPEMVIPPNGRFKLDLWNRTEAGPFTVDLTFGGVRMVGVV